MIDIHSYYRAIGFSNKLSKQLIRTVIKKAVEEYKSKLDKKSIGRIFEIYVQFHEKMGMVIHGEFLKNGEFEVEYSFPFVRANHFDYYEDISIEKNSMNDSYSGAFETDPGTIFVIFYLQNGLDYTNAKRPSKISTEAGLVGLSKSAKIILPGIIDRESKKNLESEKEIRKDLIANAKNGDEEAIENLTFSEMDTYAKISKRVVNEDVLTIVNSCFMPYGIECDKYEVIGNILEVEICSNRMTNEDVYNITIECNNIILNVYINRVDLYGEPKVGRRFKGNIWLQGNVNFRDA